MLVRTYQYKVYGDKDSHDAVKFMVDNPFEE